MDWIAAKELLLELMPFIQLPHDRLHRTLVAEGYTSIRIQRSATHPVWEIRANMPPNRPSTDRRLL